MVMLEQFIFETLRGASVCIQPSTRSTAYCLARLAGCVHCAMHRGQAGLDRHQPVSILVETSGCCCCRLQSQREQTHLPASQSISVGGSTRSERAGPGVWVGTSGPVDCLPIDVGAPLQRSAASALPEGSHRASCRGTTSFEIFCYRARESQGLCGPRPLKFKSTRGKTNAGLIILRVACVAFERRDALNERDEARAAQLRRSSDSIAGATPSQQHYHPALKWSSHRRVPPCGAAGSTSRRNAAQPRGGTRAARSISSVAAASAPSQQQQHQATAV